jgi:hypothetical protein
MRMCANDRSKRSCTARARHGGARDGDKLTQGRKHPRVQESLQRRKSMFRQGPYTLPTDLKPRSDILTINNWIDWRRQFWRNEHDGEARRRLGAANRKGRCLFATICSDGKHRPATVDI